MKSFLNWNSLVDTAPRVNFRESVSRTRSVGRRRVVNKQHSSAEAKEKESLVALRTSCQAKVKLFLFVHDTTGQWVPARLVFA